jgi:hypothetical protein
MLVTTDPKLSVQLPPGWRSIPVATFRRLVVDLMGSLHDPALKRVFESELRDFDSGAIRATGAGTSSPSCYTASLAVMIQPEARNIDEALAAWKSHLADSGLPYVQVASDPVNLAIGEGVRLTIMVDVAEGIPSRTIYYVVLLPDHRVAVFGGTAPASDPDFPALVDAAAQSMTGD